MPDTPIPAPVPETTPNGKAKRAKPSFISKDLTDAINNAGDYFDEAAKPGITAKLAERAWTADDQTSLGQLLASIDSLLSQLAAARSGKGSRTQEEQDARDALLTALDPVLKAVRRAYPDDAALRASFGIGANLSNADTAEVIRVAKYARDQLTGAPPKMTLKGLLSTEITAIATQADAYDQANWAQGQAQQTAAAILAQIRAKVETELNPLRRDLQHAADLAWTHRAPINAAQRKAFGLQADRALS